MWDETAKDMQVSWVKREVGIFLRRGVDRQISLICLRKIALEYWLRRPYATALSFMAWIFVNNRTLFPR